MIQFYQPDMSDDRDELLTSRGEYIVSPCWFNYGVGMSGLKRDRII
jgi:hypothetical protein